MFKIGLISDTHGFLDPRIRRCFKGVDHILHGGDIGFPWLLLDLERIAPVTAVLGNTDYDVPVRETETVELAGFKILVHHIVNLPTPDMMIRERIERTRPDMVVFGHTHRAHLETLGSTIYVNPGYAGRPKLGVRRSVAILECQGKNPVVRFIDLDASTDGQEE